MKIDFTVEIKGLKGEAIPGEKIIAADQFANLVMTDRGESAKTAREAFILNGLMTVIACADGPVELSDVQVTLLETVLTNALVSKRVSTFLVGRLYGLLGKEEK